MRLVCDVLEWKKYFKTSKIFPIRKKYEKNVPEEVQV